MKILSRLSKSIRKTSWRISVGFETPLDVFVNCIFAIRSKFTSESRWELYGNYLERKLVRKYRKNGVFDFKGIRFPDFTSEPGYLKSFLSSYFDVLFFYVKRGDAYPAKIIDEYEKYVESEGTYCYENPGVMDMTVKEGDIVIDAGAWIGPFSAYAAKKGAHVYAFEPSEKNRKFLDETARLNAGIQGGIQVVPLGLYDTNGKIYFSEDSVTSRIDNAGRDVASSSDDIEIETITLDDFVQKNGIKKIDFIKSDIEGAERNMLRGASWVLKNFAPKLSICTYHFKEDPELLAKIIMDANSRYKIIQRKMKLFAEAV